YLNKLEADFDENSKKLKKYPRWVSELYLEFHRGTYTSVAKNKKNNRDCEFLMQTAEQLSVVQKLLGGSEYPQNTINSCWKTILLNQFHDIIPGSSIKEVYEDSDVQYAEIRRQGGEITSKALGSIASGVDKNKGIVVYNPNSFEADGYVKIDGNTAYAAKVPALGWTTVKEADYTNKIKVGDSCIENEYYVIKFDENCNISSIYDKKNDREVVKPGCVANQIEAFEDLPYQYDNWELSAYYKQKKWCVDDVQSFEAIEDGARAGYRITRRFLDSTICQNIYVYDNNPRIDFETYLDWKEQHIVLKAAFPLNVHSDKAVYETQFGYVERPTHENTPWDAAKFEVCAHKYADISEDDYGVAILNNCKYGHNAEGSTLKLTMLKCGTYPWKTADQHEHEFTYSLLPHSGNHKQGGVIEQAYALNRPLAAAQATGDGSVADTFSLAKCDKKNIVIETVKKAEDSDAIVIRAYDAYNRRGKAAFTFGFDVKNAYLCDLMENKLSQLDITDGRTVSTDVSTFEIVTIMVEPE
ncbi:MAG: alpha-mannosidase, partial [Clostridia bacterium]|nr:alpha-mannosidase [Clostridia bacterium]